MIVFEITEEKGKTTAISFDRRILNFNIEYLSNNHQEPYPIPNNIACSTRPFEIMREFITAHDYNPASVKVVKPIRSANYSDVVDPLTLKLFGSTNYLMQSIVVRNCLSRCPRWSP